MLHPQQEDSNVSYRCFQNQKDSAELSSDLLEGENITGLGLDAWESEEWLAGAER